MGGGACEKDGLEGKKAAVLRALGDGSMTVLIVRPGYWKSPRSCPEVLRNLRDRGLRSPLLVIGDGNLGM